MRTRLRARHSAARAPGDVVLHVAQYLEARALCSWLCTQNVANGSETHQKAWTDALLRDFASKCARECTMRCYAAAAASAAGQRRALGVALFRAAAQAVWSIVCTTNGEWRSDAAVHVHVDFAALSVVLHASVDVCKGADASNPFARDSVALVAMGTAGESSGHRALDSLRALRFRAGDVDLVPGSVTYTLCPAADRDVVTLLALVPGVELLRKLRRRTLAPLLRTLTRAQLESVALLCDRLTLTATQTESHAVVVGVRQRYVSRGRRPMCHVHGTSGLVRLRFGSMVKHIADRGWPRADGKRVSFPIACSTELTIECPRSGKQLLIVVGGRSPKRSRFSVEAEGVEGLLDDDDDDDDECDAAWHPFNTESTERGVGCAHRRGTPRRVFVAPTSAEDAAASSPFVHTLRQSFDVLRRDRETGEWMEDGVRTGAAFACTARTLEVEWRNCSSGATSSPLVVTGIWVPDDSVFLGDGGGDCSLLVSGGGSHCDSRAAAADGGGGGSATRAGTRAGTRLTAETGAGAPFRTMEVTLTMHYTILNALLCEDCVGGGFDRREYAAAFPRFWPPGRGI